MAFIKVYSMRIWNINTQPTPIRNTTVGAPSKAVENRHLEKSEGALGTQPTFLHSIFESFMRCCRAIPNAPPPNKWANRSTSFDMNVCACFANQRPTSSYYVRLLYIGTTVTLKSAISTLFFSLDFPWKYKLKSPSRS